jgi:hypothetical protein
MRMGGGFARVGKLWIIDKTWEWEVGLQAVKVERYPNP